jgi:hypothetical protein
MTPLQKITTRGYWSVRIRPEIYAPDFDLSYENLEAAVRTSVVNLRGWDLPHIDLHESPSRIGDFVEQQIAFSHYIELWRAYRSKQFGFIKGMQEDWFDQEPALFRPAIPDWKPGAIFVPDDAIFRLVEIFEFAARWATAMGIKGAVVIDIRLEKLQERALRTIGSSRLGRFHSPKVCKAPRWAWRRPEASPIPVADLLSSTRDLAAGAAVSLFELFRWDVRPDTIKEIQSELRGLR